MIEKDRFDEILEEIQGANKIADAYYQILNNNHSVTNEELIVLKNRLQRAIDIINGD